jgi:error-prone DNA polymerase
MPRAGGVRCALLNSQPMGFYRPAQTRAGRAPARHRGAPGGRALQRLGLHAGADEAKSQVALPMPTAEEEVRTDYAMTGLTLGKHPLQLLRSRLRARRYRRSSELRAMPHGREVAFAGLVTLRQRPQTASGVTFLTLEDEDGLVNVVVWRQIADEQRRPLLESRLLAVEGKLESQDGVQHLIARKLTNLSMLLGPLEASSRDFR